MILERQMLYSVLISYGKFDHTHTGRRSSIKQPYKNEIVAKSVAKCDYGCSNMAEGSETSDFCFDF